MNDVFGTAILDYYNNCLFEDIRITADDMDEDTLSVAYLFRTYNEMPSIEQKALQLCHGTVLDIGCGAGSHALFLQENKYQVTALDSSKGAIEVCQKRGLKHLVHSEISSYSKQKYDTILLLMNGIGLSQTIADLPTFLLHLKNLLRPNGQILLDSSDLRYLYEEEADGGYYIPCEKNYYGEMNYTIRYKSLSQKMSWLYVDPISLEHAAASVGLRTKLIESTKNYHYLAQLKQSS